MKTDKRKEDQRLASQNLRDKKAKSTDKLSLIADRIEKLVTDWESHVNKLAEKGNDESM